MGFDALYQAIPGDFPLVELARRDRGMGEWLSSLPWLLQDPRVESLAPGEPEPGELRLLELSKELSRARPDLATRQVLLHRRWDHLHFVLSARRREAPDAEDGSLARIAIRGETEIAPHVVAGQGVPLRFTRPETVKDIARMLDALHLEPLRTHFTFERLTQAHVYKCPSEDAVEADWEWLREHFEQFRAFHATAAAHGDGVLVRID
ncbi:YfbM family protein [Myxococcus sp. K15C18031901]|uniref:DUF1877 family protein n=1 Tax=Myxococcus dinghuensis TaxID=2906761 RepID=UPI0020A7FA89|nr:DUF1877 family protein [Myxococcus dinghuensis]MCP3097872.1 YfbM family protein [Myxococcus dinghuensis]